MGCIYKKNHTQTRCQCDCPDSRFQQESYSLFSGPSSPQLFAKCLTNLMEIIVIVLEQLGYSFGIRLHDQCHMTAQTQLEGYSTCDMCHSMVHIAIVCIFRKPIRK